MRNMRLAAALGLTVWAAVPLAQAANENVSGSWSPLYSLPLVPISGGVLPNGKVLLWAADGQFKVGSPSPKAYTVLIDPQTQAQQQMIAYAGHNMFCTGTANLPDGRILVNGGSQSQITSVFDPANNSFTRVQDMNVPRGYSANAVLPDGSVLTLGGSWSGQGTTVNKVGEIWTSSGGWRSLPGVPTTSMLSGDASYFASDTHYWLIPSGNGKVLYAGPAPGMRWINTGGSGAVSDAGPRADDTVSISGSAVMYDAGKIFKTGGGAIYTGTYSSNKAYTIDTSTGVAQAASAGTMAYGRGFQNSVVLPDGKVVIVGGQSYLTTFSDSDAVLATEMWNPVTRKFTVTAPIAVPRNYHSIALLLPDGRVLSGGGGLCGCSADHPNYQIFTPPNLFDAGGALAVRPVITAAPAEFSYGGTAQVTTDSAVTSFAMVRVASTTHTVNNDQRRLTVSFSKTGTNQYRLNVPSNSGYLLPGYWMLFAMNARGVPSVSKIVHVSPNDIARMVSPDPVSVRTGVAVGVQPEISNLTAGTLTFGGTGLPPGVSVNPATGYVSGTPSVAGSYLGQITATDGVRTVSTDVAMFVDQGAAAGTGLLGEYFATTNLSGAVVMRRAEAVDLSVTAAGPGGGVPGAFSARWSGKVMAMRSGPTVFQTVSDDGVRVWVDGTLLIDNWTPHGATANAGTITLTSGQSYAIEIAYNNTSGQGDLHLSWQRPGDAGFSIIPASQLYPAAPAAGANIALGKAAAQSTTYASGMEAGKAVDGIKAAGSNFSSTLGNANEWWQVDLGARAAIDRIKLWNRVDCCTERLQNFYVFASNSDLTGKSIGDILADATVAKRSVGASAIDDNIEIPGGISGRFVRVELAGSNFLNLREVEVFGRTNQAPSIITPATQVSSIGGEVSLPVTASDGDGDPLTYAATGLPGGLSIDATTGLIHGTLTAYGSFTTTVTATDPGGLSASASFGWNIADVVPYVKSLPVVPQQAGAAVTYRPVIGNPAGARYAWNFGDGSATTGWTTLARATHTFASPGIYTVTLSLRSAGGALSSYRFDQAVSTPALAAGFSASSGSSLYETRGAGASPRLWVANRDNDTVAVIDLGTRRRIAEIPVGSEPFGIARNPNGQIWVTNRKSATVSVIDPASLAVVRTIALSHGTRPGGLVFGASGEAYFSYEGWGQLGFLSPYGDIWGWVGGGNAPRYVAANSAGNRIYVSQFITPPLPGENTATVATVTAAGAPAGGEVWEFDGDGGLRRKFILQHSERADTQVSARGIPNYLGAPAVSPDGKSLWVPSKQDNIKRGMLRDGQPLDFENTVRAIVSRVDLTTGLEDLSSRIDVDNSGIVSAIAFHPSGAYLFAALQASREVAVLDPARSRELFRFKVGRAPETLTVSPDGKMLYVGNMMDRTVSIVDLAPMLNAGQKAVIIRATIRTIARETLRPAVLTGKQLFYDAADTRLARDGYLSCAVCHDDGGGDGRVWDLTGFGEGLRNTISLEGHGGRAQGFLHWSANFDEVQDFEGQIRSLAGGTGLMADSDFFAGTRSQPLGDKKAGISAPLDALAAYVTSLNIKPQSPWRNPDGTMTAAALAGQAVFASNGCANCHGGAEFTISSNASKLKNIGTITQPASGKRLGGPLTGIDVPTLRGVWATGPYLHDGSASGLYTAIFAHPGIGIGNTDMNNLVRYLKELE